MSVEHGSQLKELPEAKDGTIRNNVHKDIKMELNLNKEKCE